MAPNCLCFRRSPLPQPRKPLRFGALRWKRGHWLGAEVRDAGGHLLLRSATRAVHINWGPRVAGEHSTPTLSAVPHQSANCARELQFLAAAF